MGDLLLDLMCCDRRKILKSREFLEFIRDRRKEIYNDPKSILKKYDDYLALNGIYHTEDTRSFEEKLKGHTELSEMILSLYREAELDNEKISLLEDLYATGYNKDKLTEIILEAFFSKKVSSHLWQYGDLLYKMKRYKYLDQYISIIKDKTYGEDRQMVVCLVGKSKKEKVIPILKELLNDDTIEGHVVDALTNFSGEDIVNIMEKYSKCDRIWIRNMAKNYLSKKGNTKI